MGNGKGSEVGMVLQVCSRERRVMQLESAHRGKGRVKGWENHMETRITRRPMPWQVAGEE